MLRRWVCQADIRIVIEPVDPVLIKSGYVGRADMVPVSTFKDGEETYFFPGSSLKGVLRSHVERIARTLCAGSVCLPYYDPNPRRTISVPVAAEAGSYGCGYRRRGTGQDSASEAYADSCAACRLFGSLKFGGRLSISDAYPLPDSGPRGELRNGVGIDRFTGGTVSGVLFDLEVVVGGKFEASLRLTNFELWQLAALNILLADLQDEMINIGSGRSRGLGRIRVDVSSYRVSYVQAMTRLDGLHGLVNQQEQCAYRLHHWTPQAPVQLPEVVHHRGLRCEYDLSSDWSARLEPLTPAFECFLRWSNGPRGTAAARYEATEDQDPLS